jgi:hypothetical protein
MQFKIQSAMGSSFSSECREDFIGLHRSFVVAANDRVDAFIRIFRRFTQQGYDVTVLRVNGTANPLNFSSDDLAAIHAAGIPVRTGYPKAGYQIEEIVPA